MKIFSAELTYKNDKLIAKTAVMLKKRSGYVLLKNYTTDADNLQPLSAGLPLNIGIDYYDVIDESVSIPPVKDLKTFRIIAYNKLKENFEEDVEYLMAYKENVLADPDESGNKAYKVFLAPRDVLDVSSGLNEEQKKNLNIFTVSDFALSGIIQKYYPGKMAFHAYADDHKITVIVCYNDIVLYTRTNEIDEPDAKKRVNMFYENLNLTFMYVSKNLRLDIDIIILSGELSSDYDLSKMVSDFTPVPQAVLLPFGHIENCSHTDFHKYMIPIALNFMSDSYDFTPAKYKVEQGVNLITTAASIITVLLIFVMIFMNIGAVQDFFDQKSKIDAQTAVMKVRLKKHTESFEDTLLRKFGLYYYQQERKKATNPVRMYKDLKLILDLAEYPVVEFGSDKSKNILAIDGVVKFLNLREIDLFQQRLDNSIKELANNKNYSITNKSRFDMDKLYVTMNVKIEIGKNAFE